MPIVLPAASASLQAASTAAKPSLSLAGRIFTIWRSKIALANLAYNFNRLAWLTRQTLPA